ncbi:MAG: hypothetical protein H0T59_01860 [Chloroflexi bacterium]|nr:hypothetical protein [Chloroflexota bacterium]
MTVASRPPKPPTGRAAALVLAHAHLRLGLLALAQTELETLAELGRLDTAGLVDLAEVRWRTGDMTAAGEAAVAALRANDEDPVALLIASEAATANGRPSEARRLALRAMAFATGSIDVIFAGMSRSVAWPPDADEPPPTAPTLFDRPSETIIPDAGDPTARSAAAGSGAVTTGSTVVDPTGPVELGFWDDGEAGGPVAIDLPDPAKELEAGRAALVAGSLDEAALRFGLAVRLAPALAPTVLEVTAGARVPALIIVRGDAYRSTGHEQEAREAYAIAARGGLPERRKRSRGKASKPRRTSSRKSAAAAEPSASGTPDVTEADVITPPDAPSAEPAIDRDVAEGAKATASVEAATETAVDEASVDPLLGSSGTVGADIALDGEPDVEPAPDDRLAGNPDESTT